ncbi:iron complex transport system ATP-binding protein [Mumia flava]|uniref:Iron complex transport system ATP-binding protein n=1 Tax=Mumia flava TaxID=1348852 RepID=A0A0B2BH15_9ACTN|nr:ABC transporter ATP-binding protein [Mumia flava]PJJ58319.1 iron complex transport system ATP-binding protein [Mumia flava]
MTTVRTTAEVRLEGRGLQVAYDGRAVLADLDIRLPTGRFTAVVGPNACGKSTLLRTLARILSPVQGTVLLDGRPITDRSSKEVARTLGLLPQAPVVVDGIVVEDLVARGRFPHQSLLRQWSRADERAVESAMRRAGVLDLRDRVVDELSGGQRQRVWIAMALAQETSLLLLDEPTTFLDLAHQVEVLDLCADLVESGTTVVAVLHDLNLAFRYADHVVVMHDGELVAQGTPAEVVDAELLERVFALPCRVVPDPETRTPLVVPLARSRRCD